MEQTAVEFARQLRHSMTEAEQRLWKHLRAHRLLKNKFRRQQPIGPYIVDFIHLGARLIVEVDGGQHLEKPKDAVRDAWLKARGFRVLRFCNDDVLKKTEAVLEQILLGLNSANSPSPQSLPREGGGAIAEAVTKAAVAHSPVSPPPSRGRGQGRGGGST